MENNVDAILTQSDMLCRTQGLTENLTCDVFILIEARAQRKTEVELCLLLDPALTLIFLCGASTFTSNSNHPSLVFPREAAVGHFSSLMLFRLLFHMYNRLYSFGRPSGEILTFWVTASHHFLKTNHVAPRGIERRFLQYHQVLGLYRRLSCSVCTYTHSLIQVDPSNF